VDVLALLKSFSWDFHVTQKFFELIFVSEDSAPVLAARAERRANQLGKVDWFASFRLDYNLHVWEGGEGRLALLQALAVEGGGRLSFAESSRLNSVI